MTQERRLSYLLVELCMPEYTAIICPIGQPDTEKTCCKLIGDGDWLDVKAGDMVKLRRKGDKRDYWAQVRVRRIVLYRVHPVEFNDRVVTCGRDWIEGRDDGRRE